MLTGTADTPVNHVCSVLGRDLEISDEEKVTCKNEPAIRARGQIDVELSSDWIQSKAMADVLSTWMAKHWSLGVDNVTMVIFGNPLLEIGDVVGVSYTEKDMNTSTHKYYVVGTSTSFDTGLETTLTLRRVRPAADSDLS